MISGGGSPKTAAEYPSPVTKFVVVKVETKVVQHFKRFVDVNSLNKLLQFLPTISIRLWTSMSAQSSKVA